MHHSQVDKNDRSSSDKQPVVECALILCGGRGTRLAPFLPNVQKCCAPLGPTTPLEIIYRRLRLIGIESFVFLTGHLAPDTEATIRCFADDHSDIAIIPTNPDKSTGQTIDSIREVLPSAFLYHHGNLILADYHYGALIRAYGETKRTTLLVCDNNKGLTHPVMGIDSKGYVGEVGRHSISSTSFLRKSSVGVGIYKSEDLDRAVDSDDDMTTEQYLRLGSCRIAAVQIDQNWIHIENSEDYEDAKERYVIYAPK